MESKNLSPHLFLFILLSKKPHYSMARTAGHRDIYNHTGINESYFLKMSKGGKSNRFLDGSYFAFE